MKKPGMGKYRSSINEQNRKLFGKDTRSHEQKIADLEYSLRHLQTAIAENDGRYDRTLITQGIARYEAQLAEMRGTA